MAASVARCQSSLTKSAAPEPDAAIGRSTLRLSASAGHNPNLFHKSVTCCDDTLSADTSRTRECVCAEAGAFGSGRTGRKRAALFRRVIPVEQRRERG
jgi:hypothetical protein